jgi:predicted helicase
VKKETATIYYHDIGDYLDRDQKLKIISGFKTFANQELSLTTLQPNVEGDWISMRNASFDGYIPLEPEGKQNLKTQSFFLMQNPGLLSARESWVYNFNKETLIYNMSSMISFYEEQRSRIDFSKISEVKSFDGLYDTNPTKISWSRALKNDLRKNKEHHSRRRERLHPGASQATVRQDRHQRGHLLLRLWLPAQPRVPDRPLPSISKRCCPASPGRTCTRLLGIQQGWPGAGRAAHQLRERAALSRMSP